MTKPKFDIVAISRNEEKHIPKMMESLKEFQERGGNVYILDTGSTDNTVEVAKSLGCKVQAVGDKFRIQIDQELADKINSKFVVEGEIPVVQAGDSLFDFASARNHCVSFTEQDMVSTMDCDEVFTKLDIDKINKYIEDGYNQFEYSFVFSHDAEGNPVIKFRQSKFYDKTKTKWVGIIHEVLQGPGNIMNAPEDVIKLEHWQNEETNRTGYLKGLAVDCFNNPENDRNSHYFAREMMYCGRFKSAIKEFENHISMNKWVTEASQSMLYIGDCYRSLGDVDNMIKWYTKSFEKEARREPLMRLAEHYFKDGRYAQVIAYCEAALTITELPFYSNHQPYYDNLPHELLYTAYWWVDKKDKSKEHWQKAIKFSPTNPKYLSDAQFYGTPTKIDEYTKNIVDNINFSFVKKGDGEIDCMAGKSGCNGDYHKYSEELGKNLEEAYEFLNGKENVDVVNWDNQINYNIFLHRTDTNLEKLRDFWMTVKKSPRRKIFIGPKRLSGVCDLLKASAIEIPDLNAFDFTKTMELPDVLDDDIFILSAGMPAKGIIADLIKKNPNITCIDAGSSFDPIFVATTRTKQITKEKAHSLYFDSKDAPLRLDEIDKLEYNLYNDPQIEGMMTPSELEWLYKTSKTVDSFLEIGSYKGKSTHAILSGGAKAVYAVDHFVGSSDPIETGNLDTYDAFIKNTEGFENLNVRKMSSLEAVKEFEDKSLDVVFIDGGHRIQEITEDIVAWLPKAKKIICGHDYNDKKAVRLAVDALLGPVNVCDRIWWKEIDGTEVIDMEKANKLARYLDTDLVNKMFALPQESHPEKLFVVDNVEGEVIYDLGCGKFKKVEESIGVDIEPNTDIQASIDKLPMIDSGTADTIISCHSLEHMADAENTLKEWRRILKPGGKIVLILPDDEFINTLDPIISAGVHLQAFTRDSLKQLVESISGLEAEPSETVVENWSFGTIIRKQVPKITFVVPTLGREEGLQRCLDSIEALDYPKNKIEVIVKQDSFDNRIGVPKLLKQGVEESTGDWVVFASNDTEFDPESINEALKVGELGYVAFNTGPVLPDEGNINEHFMIRKDIIAKIGEVFDTEFYHVGVDNLLYAKMKKLGIFKRADLAIVKHNHFTKGAEMDETYREGWKEERVAHDRALLEKKLLELNK